MEKLLIVAFSFLVSGCLAEANFGLHESSRLPKWFEVPPGRGRGDFKVYMASYIYPHQWKTVLKIYDKDGFFYVGKVVGYNKSPKVDGREVYRFEYPNYLAIKIDGVTDILEFRAAEPVFYMTDDPVVWQQLKEMGEERFNMKSLHPVK